MGHLARVISIESLQEARKELLSVGVHAEGLEIMAPKAVFKAIKIKGLGVVAANILKQDMLSRGGDAATSKGTIDHSEDRTDVILLGTVFQYISLAERLKAQQFGLPRLGEEILHLIRIYESLPNSILGLEFGKKTYLMGILNVTPDSFSDGGKYVSTEDALAHAQQMINDGARIIDVGGESTRPGAAAVQEDEEIHRVVPVIKLLGAGGQNRSIISIDTRKASVAEAAIKAGANMINDVSGLRYDKDMAEVAAKHKVPLIIMHSKGDPSVMQNDPRYEDLISEILLFFEESMAMALKAGVKEDLIILDPGIGFGKTFDHNLEILRRLHEFRCFGRPVCIGVSRKSFIGRITGEEPSKRLESSLAASVLAISKKVDIIRIHDMNQAAKAVAVADAVTRKSAINPA
ncbi:MAG: dihydropteroate synthase [Candidatus Margulisiibacteriota bacterium]